MDRSLPLRRPRIENRASRLCSGDALYSSRREDRSHPVGIPPHNKHVLEFSVFGSMHGRKDQFRRAPHVRPFRVYRAACEVLQQGPIDPQGPLSRTYLDARSNTSCASMLRLPGAERDSERIHATLRRGTPDPRPPLTVWHEPASPGFCSYIGF